MVFALMVAIVAFRPVASDDFWWELSRGREVVRGSMAPSRVLLALETARDADWLGGVPLFLVYSLSGSFGLMLLRISAATALAWCICRSARGTHPAILGVLVFAGLIGAERAFDLGPRMFDVLGIVAVFWLAKHLTAAVTLRDLLLTVMLFVMWSNTAPRVAVGWIMLASALLQSRGTDRWLQGRSMLLILIAAAGAICLTPRGFMSVRDSLLLVVPQLATASWALADTPWQPLSWSTWGAAELAFLGLSCVLFGLLALSNKGRDWRMVAACCTAQILPWISVGNLEQATVWSVLLAGEMFRDFTTAEDDVTERPRPLLAWPRWLAPGAAVAGCALLIACGPWALLATMGWGLHSKLDNRMLSLALHSIKAQGTVFSANVQSAGMMCWLAPASLQIQDVPQRALLGGRWPQQQLLRADLQLERQNTYCRSDGSQGGWWIPLRQRDTSLLMIDADDTSLIRGLEPSIWKPLSLDSSVIPYAAAGDPGCNDRLIEVLQQRELVDFGPWIYSPPLSTGSEFDRDWFGLRPEVVDPSATLRQCRVFVAMRLPVAALKVLHATLPRAATSELQAEFARCQMDLAHSEAVAAGRPSQFRGLALREALGRTDRRMSVAPALLAGLDDAPEDLLLAINRYGSGALAQAQEILTSESPQSQYAAACIAIEGGQLGEAATILHRAAASETDRALALLIAARLEELEVDP